MRIVKNLLIAFVLLSMAVSPALFAGGGSEPVSSTGRKTYELTFSTVAGAAYTFPVYFQFPGKLRHIPWMSNQRNMALRGIQGPFLPKRS